MEEFYQSIVICSLNYLCMFPGSSLWLLVQGMLGVFKLGFESRFFYFWPIDVFLIFFASESMILDV